MSTKSFFLEPVLYDYLCQNSLREPVILHRLREETAAHPMARMQISPEQGQFIAWLVRLARVKRGIEVGVFTGYSSLCAALAMPEEGFLLACDVSESWTAVAQRYWQEAGVADRIELRLDAAVRTLDRELASGASASYDYAFIDADKTNYIAYYERCLELLRPGGILLVDNVLWSGAVTNPAIQDEDTVALREFNAYVHADARVDLSMLPLGDGLTLCRKL